MNRFVDPQPGHWLRPVPAGQAQTDSQLSEGWFPKLGFWSGRVVYFDTHAGRGSYAGDNPGSPLVRLGRCLGTGRRTQLLDNSEFPVRVSRVGSTECVRTQERGRIEELPSRIFVDVECGDAFQVLRREIDALKLAGQQMAPAFLFVDPYGFSLPGDLLAEIMEFERVELFVNVMWRELDMAIRQEPAAGHGQAENLDRLFGGDAWRSIRDETMVGRADQAAKLLADRVGAKWWTHVRMVPGGDAVRFFLLHLTNHDDGRDLMKECVWRVCPGGSMSVRRSEDPNQFFLIEEEPDLTPLQDWVVARLQSGPVSTDTLKEELRSQIWRWKPFDMWRRLRQRGRLRRRGGTLSLLPKQEGLFR